VRIRLVVPADVDAVTGGNTYDLALADALRAALDEVTIVRCEPPALSATLRTPWTGHTLVDGLLACPQPKAVASANVGVLVHMPLALETGLAPDRAAELDRLERQSLHAAGHVVTISRWSARYIERHHGVREVAVVPPGVDRAPVSRGSDPPLLAHVAALLPHKDQLGVVAALGGLTDLSWRARLAGPLDRDPDYAAAVGEAVRMAGLTDRVEITGTLTRDEAWAEADLALLPSLVETFGMVVVEALARGIPALVSEGGAVEALGVTVGGERPGMVVPAADPEALSRTLRRWLSDGRYRSHLRTLALSRRDALDGWDVTAERMRHVLSCS
jgi:glycosyltransferase involved in cell wall biosynthesis